MEGTKPLDRLRIQGNSTSRNENSMNKTTNHNSSQPSRLPEITSANNPLLNKLNNLRRYAFPNRTAFSEYSSRGKDGRELGLNVRGKTIYWDTDMGPSTSNHSSVKGVKSFKHTSYQSESSAEMYDFSVPEVPVALIADRSNGISELHSVVAGNTLFELDHVVLPVAYSMNRNNKLRHSYHGAGSLSLTGQKLNTPRELNANNEQPRPTSYTLLVSAEEDVPIYESMPNISASSPVHKRPDRAEISHRAAPQRAIHSAALKQCLQIQKPSKQEDNSSFMTHSDSLKSSYLLPITNGETRTRNEVIDPKRYQFDSVDSYIYYNIKNTKQEHTNQNGFSPRALVTSQISTSSSEKSVRGNSTFRPRPEFLKTYPTVKKYPNLNGIVDVKLSVVGSSPAGKTQTEKELITSRDVNNSSKDAKISNDVADISTARDSLGHRNELPDDTQVTHTDSNEKIPRGQTNPEPSLRCIPLNTASFRNKSHRLSKDTTAVDKVNIENIPSDNKINVKHDEELLK